MENFGKFIFSDLACGEVSFSKRFVFLKMFPMNDFQYSYKWLLPKSRDWLLQKSFFFKVQSTVMQII